MFRRARPEADLLTPPAMRGQRLPGVACTEAACEQGRRSRQDGNDEGSPHGMMLAVQRGKSVASKGLGSSAAGSSNSDLSGVILSLKRVSGARRLDGDAGFSHRTLHFAIKGTPRSPWPDYAGLIVCIPVILALSALSLTSIENPVRQALKRSSGVGKLAAAQPA
jgi:hypothetical protein